MAKDPSKQEGVEDNLAKMIAGALKMDEHEVIVFAP